MLFIPLLGLVLASFTPLVSSQLPLDQATAALKGTWSSGSKNVLTGPGFANPANKSFTYPPTTGISYSFSDPFYESSRYRFNSNGSDPTCITGVIGWSHGKYQLNPNGSMTLFPFPDGFQQIQDPCAAVSNFIEDYRITEELYVMWQIFMDQTAGLKLHLFQYDGAPLSPMFQISTQPNMLPTQQLRNISDPNGNSNTDPNASNVQRRGLPTSGAHSSRRTDNAIMTGISALIVAALGSLAL